jgi:predicted histone-like DNA-binding protein
MRVKLKVVERRNPSNLDLPAKFYAKAITHDVIGIDEMCEMISDQCTVSEYDILAVLNSLDKNISKQIKKGNLVQLGRIGSFQLSLRSAGSDSAEEVTSENVLRNRIIFRPSPRMKKELKTLSFRKVS